MTYEELVEEVRKEAKNANIEGISEHIAYQINIEGEAEGALYIEISDGEVKVEPYEYYDRDALIITSAENIIKIMQGKMNPVIAFLSHHIRVEGDLGKAALLERILKK